MNNKLSRVTRMKKKLLILLGVVTMLLGLWGGALLCHYFTVQSDFMFAAFCTGILIFGSGVALIIVATTEYP